MTEPSEKGESQWDDTNIICPYCKYEFQPEGCDYDRECEDECEGCGKTFTVVPEYSVTYWTYPIEEVKGQR